MKENDEDEKENNNINKTTNNINEKINNNVLDKLRILKDENLSNNLLQKTNNVVNSTVRIRINSRGIKLSRIVLVPPTRL